MMISDLRQFVPKLRRAVITSYNKRLISLVLYGSVGRQTPNYESDIDILIIAEQLPKGRMKRMREFERVERNLQKEIARLHKKGIYTSLSPVIKSKEEVLIGSPLFLDMVYDSVILHDKKNFFRRYIKKLKGKLKDLGAKRVNLGDYWYWILKSDYEPGEVFEI